MKKSFKKLFSVVAVCMMLASQTPLTAILWIAPAKAAADYEILSSDFTVSSPVGTEVRNGTKTITWTTSSLSTDVDLWYCAGADCGNGSYTLIAANQPNNLSYSWDTTTATAWDSAQYKIRVSLPWGSNGGMSPNYFTLDNTVPSISIWDNILAWPVWSDSFAATITDTNISTRKYGYVNNSSDCTTSVNTAGFTAYTSASTVNLTDETHNGKYVCFYADDTAGNKNVAVSANPINIDITNPSISITDNILVWPTSSDSFAATLTEANPSILKYGFVAAAGNCTTAVNTSSFTTYTSTSTVTLSDQSHNTNYLCFYAQDQVGRSAVAVSANPINIDITNPTMPSNTLTAPNGGTYRTWWSIHAITWANASITDTNLAANPITLAYSTNGGDSRTQIATNEANDGSYTWTTPNTSSTFLVRITAVDTAGNSSSDTSDSTFIIDNTAPTVSSVVASPNPGSWTVNVTVYFTEALAGMYISQPPTVALFDWSYRTVTASAVAGHTNGFRDDNHNVWEWTIDVSSRTNGTLNFAVSWAKDNALNLMTLNSSAGSMVVDTVAPTFTVNNSVSSWTTSDTINVTVADVTAGVASSTYGFSSDATCNWSDTITTAFTSNSNFSIEWNHIDYLCVKAVDNAGNVSYQTIGQLHTDNTYPAMNGNTLTAPNGWEKWAGGSTHNITWGSITDTNLATNPITLAYSTDGWDNWTQIATSEANDGSYTWTIPAIDYDTVLVRVSAVDNAGNISTDVSNTVLTLDNTHPTTSITNPTSSQVIAWPTRLIESATTDNFNISSVVFYYNSSNDAWEGSQVISTDTSYPYTASFNTTALADGTWYLFTVAIDEAGNTTTSAIIPVTIDNTKPEILNNTLNFPSDVSGSWTLAGRATHRSLNITQVEYFVDAIWDNDDWYDLSLWAGTTAKDFGDTINVSALSNGRHTLYVHAMNSEWVRGTGYANKTFRKWSAAPDITSLYMSDITNSSATINWDSTTEPDTAEYRIKENNGTFSSWSSLGHPQSIGELSTTTTYIVEIRLAAGVNSSTDTVSFTTASASDGIIVDSISRILNGNTPTPGGDYESGYHFRFNLTLNDIFADTLNFKLADWSNSATTTAVANNTKIYVSENGIDSANHENQLANFDPQNHADYFTTLTGADTYSEDLYIYHLDSDSSKWGNQIILDMFYKIPTWAQGIFSTNYGIKTTSDPK